MDTTKMFQLYFQELELQYWWASRGRSLENMAKC